MSIGPETDWVGLRAVGRIVRQTLAALERHARPGMTTGELDRVAASVFAGHGARSAPALVYGFPGTVLISVNDEVVHGVPGSRRLERGDVVKLDVTAEKDGYMADAARTVVLSGGSAVARRLRDCARAAFAEALGAARAGNPVRAIGRAVEAEVRRRGFTVIRELAGHGIGRTIHEDPVVPNFDDPRRCEILSEGLVVTLEPIVCGGTGEAYGDADGWTVRTRDGSLAAHHEHTVVITHGRPVLLT